MSNDQSRVRDAFEIAMARGRVMADGARVFGHGIIELRGPGGELKLVQPFTNLITTYGDEYYAKRGAAGVLPQNNADLTKVVNMQLGTGTTAATKSGATTAKIETFIANSENPFDATYPQFVDETGDTGWSISYKTTWGAGDSTNAAITEAVITSEATANTASAVNNTISRVVFTAINKGASDTLAITWKHTFNAS